MTAVIFIIANIIYGIDELYTRSTCVAHWKRSFVESFVESLFAIDAHTIYRMHSTFRVVATISLMLFFFSFFFFQEKCESKRERRVHPPTSTLYNLQLFKGRSYVHFFLNFWKNRMRVIESREIFINVYLTNKDIPTHLLLFCKLMFTQLLSQHPFFFFFFFIRKRYQIFQVISGKWSARGRIS